MNRRQNEDRNRHTTVGDATPWDRTSEESILTIVDRSDRRTEEHTNPVHPWSSREKIHHAVGNRGVQAILGGASGRPTISDPDGSREQEAERVARAVGHSSRTVARTTHRWHLQDARLVDSTLYFPEREHDNPELLKLRSAVERQVGQDVGDVQIHTASEAAKATVTVGAEALTIGRHIFFSNGAYDPSTTKGQLLLSHELTHVAQANRSENATANTSPTIYRKVIPGTDEGTRNHRESEDGGSSSVERAIEILRQLLARRTAQQKVQEGVKETERKMDIAELQAKLRAQEAKKRAETATTRVGASELAKGTAQTTRSIVTDVEQHQLLQKTVMEFKATLSKPPQDLQTGSNDLDELLTKLQNRDVNVYALTQAYEKDVGVTLVDDILNTYRWNVLLERELETLERNLENASTESVIALFDRAESIVSRIKKLIRNRRMLIGELTATLEPLDATKRGRKKQADATGEWQAHKKGYERYVAENNVPYEGMASTWEGYLSQIRSMEWFGHTVYGHELFLERLKRAQNYIAAEHPALLENGKLFDGVSSTWRAHQRNTSYHVFGMAIDIDARKNPWLSNEPSQRKHDLWTIWRAVWLVGGPNAEPFSAKRASASRSEPTETIWNRYDATSRAVTRYFQLLDNPEKLAEHVDELGEKPPGLNTANDVPYTGNRSISQLAAADIGDWRATIEHDKKGLSRDDLSTEYGFMNLRLELVKALRDEADLAWGAVGFGSRQSGDFMHFDMRNTAFARLIRKIKKER